MSIDIFLVVTSTAQQPKDLADRIATLETKMDSGFIDLARQFEEYKESTYAKLDDILALMSKRG